MQKLVTAMQTILVSQGDNCLVAVWSTWRVELRISLSEIMDALASSHLQGDMLLGTAR